MAVMCMLLVHMQKVRQGTEQAKCVQVQNDKSQVMTMMHVHRDGRVRSMPHACQLQGCNCI